MVLTESSEEERVAHDWRGEEVRVGTRVVYRNKGWGIGRVAYVYSDKRHVEVRPEEKQNYRGAADIAYPLPARSVTVWPDQSDPDPKEVSVPPYYGV